MMAVSDSMTAFRLPENLHREARLVAALEDMTLSELMRRALEERVAEAIARASEKRVDR
jgi:predicted HicB family RNase H-like nuclease